MKNGSRGLEIRPFDAAEHLKGDEEAQVYLIAPDGGEARRLTDVPTGVFGIKWFPDSRRIAFLSWVWPDAKGGLGKLAKRYKAFKDDKVKAHVVEHVAYRWWDRWLTDGRVPRLFTVDIETGAVRDLFAGTRYEIARADPTAHHYDIAPDGREIVFSFDPAPDKRFDHEYQLVALDLRARRFRTLTTRSPLNHETPRYSPDGRWIALITQNLRRSAVDTHAGAVDRCNATLRVATSRWAAQSILRGHGARLPRRVRAAGTRAPHSPLRDRKETPKWRARGVLGDFDVAGARSPSCATT